jgi:ABC-type branched-subunit amino acid transport system substrate-binding protein
LLAPLTGSAFAKPIGQAMTAAVEAAIRTYNQTVDGQPGSPRPLVAVICDETKDVVAATEHLVDTLKAKAIVGPFDEKKLDSIVSITNKANVVVMSPFADGPNFQAKYASSGLVWSCAANRSGALVYLKNLLQFVVDTIRKSRDASFDPVVALYTSDDGAASEMGAAALAKNLFPGPTTSVSYPYFLTAMNATDYATFANQAIDKRANLIVNFGSGLGDFDKIVQKMEVAWRNNGTPSPYYVSYQRSSNLATALVEDMEANPDGGSVRTSYERTLVFDQPQSDSVRSAHSVFAGKFEGLMFGTKPAEQISLAYDCTMVLAFGLQAARKESSTLPESVTGEQFRAGMARLLSGEPWGFGSIKPGTIFSALATSDATVDIYGASGDLPFVVENGYPVTDGGLWCFKLDFAGYRKAVHHPTGVTFSSATGQLQGEFSCSPTW